MITEPEGVITSPISMIRAPEMDDHVRQSLIRSMNREKHEQGYWIPPFTLSLLHLSLDS